MRLYSFSFLFFLYTLSQRGCLAATSTRGIVFTLGITDGKLSVSFSPPTIPPLPFSRLYVIPLYLSFSLFHHHLTASLVLSRSFSLRYLPADLSLPLSFFLLLCSECYLLTSHDLSLATAERDERDVNGANFRSRIDFLLGSSR